MGVTSMLDIVRYTVDLLGMDFEGQGRTLRVQGWTGKFQGLGNEYEKARGVRYQITYLNPDDAAEKQEQARSAGDEMMEMAYSVQPLLAGGLGLTDGVRGTTLDNDKFEFVPESTEATFARMYQ